MKGRKAIFANTIEEHAPEMEITKRLKAGRIISVRIPIELKKKVKVGLRTPKRGVSRRVYKVSERWTSSAKAWHCGI